MACDTPQITSGTEKLGYQISQNAAAAVAKSDSSANRSTASVAVATATRLLSINNRGL